MPSAIVEATTSSLKSEATSPEVRVEATNQIKRILADQAAEDRRLYQLMVAMFAAGLALLLYGAIKEAWQWLVPGGIVQSCLFLPLRKLSAHRDLKLSLQVIPWLLSLDDSAETRQSIQRLVSKMIDRL